jgi:hypothetical protein
MTTALELSIRDAVFVATPELAVKDLRAFAHKVSTEMAHGTREPKGYAIHVFEAVLESFRDWEDKDAAEVANILVWENKIYDFEDWNRERLMDLEDGWYT